MLHKKSASIDWILEKQRMNHDIEVAIDNHAYAMQVDPRLVRAICQVESSGDPYKVRFEPTWKYLSDTGKFATILGITEATEHSLQSHSWGLMQVMGSVARESGFRGPLQRLSEIDLGVFYGCFKLVRIATRYHEVSDVVAAYNAGSAFRRADGSYLNQDYVDKVLTLMK